ncbi:hypothetical protein NOR51B_1917 [Luminiphilus syltensis NOR5-1B]|uniref:Uncharacterized protein n=1 Tax=Luminiphilus syltensis NOR5-1B TaxID=565045 RepID=B8KVP9_9GAMM|nr:hypothetical protein NOR51B_552 [Luminiphilus syltensis NOR5-1B]EED35969.1 hypothetical protein NOR51B_1917 [Luminiphilus syltensis NOR5-1B]
MESAVVGRASFSRGCGAIPGALGSFLDAVQRAVEGRAFLDVSRS